MSSLAQQTFRILKDNFFWIDSLSTVPGSGLDKDRQDAEIEEILDVANKINLSNGATSMKSSTTVDASVAAGGGSASMMYSQEGSLAKASSMSTRLAVECCQGCSTNLVRQQVNIYIYIYIYMYMYMYVYVCIYVYIVYNMYVICI